MTEAAAKGKRKRTKGKGLKPSFFRKKSFIFGFVLALGCLVTMGWAGLHLKKKRPVRSLSASTNEKQPTILGDLLALTPRELERCDIALMNLLCAQGLRGAEGLDVTQYLKILDSWTEQVKSETQRHEYRFNEHREEYKNSYGRYRMLMLGTVLANDLRIHYTPGLVRPQLSGEMPTFGWSSNSGDFFIHGLLGEKHEGTCASMPLLYVAIGRRLGYPVDLASSPYHLYVRYEEPNGGHFNVEATMTDGFLTPPDEDYRTGKFSCTDEEIKGHGWLRPMSNAEALSQFLHNRGTCFTLMRRYFQAREAYQAAGRYGLDTPLMRKETKYNLHALDLAPFGDRIDDLRSEVKSLSVPEGPRFAYLENRKGQVNYFLGDNTNWPSMEQAVKDLKLEVAEYRKQLGATPAGTQHEAGKDGEHTLELTSRSGKRLLLPAAGLPPPLNRGVCPPDYLASIGRLDLENEELIWDTLWTYYKGTTPDWMAQAEQLPLHPPLPENGEMER